MRRESREREKQHYSANPSSLDVEVGQGWSGLGLCNIGEYWQILTNIEKYL